MKMEAEYTDSKLKGANKSGRTWKVDKGAFRAKNWVVKNKKLTSWELKQQQRLEDIQFKEKLKELKKEKQDKYDQKVQLIKEKREKKEEKERYEKLAARMHAKRIERMKKREKRNKALKER